MKISIYELLGLIKDSKAPNKIKIEGQYFIWFEGSYRTNTIEKDYVSTYFRLENMLNDEIEIIEEVEDKEYEDIEELGNNFTYEDCTDELTTSSWEKSVMSNKINALIRNQQKIIEKLQNNK